MFILLNCHWHICEFMFGLLECTSTLKVFVHNSHSFLAVLVSFIANSLKFGDLLKFDMNQGKIGNYDHMI